jgi:hypothetical protein
MQAASAGRGVRALRELRGLRSFASAPLGSTAAASTAEAQTAATYSDAMCVPLNRCHVCSRSEPPPASPLFARQQLPEWDQHWGLRRSYMHWFMAAGTLGLFGTVQVVTGCTVARALLVAVRVVEVRSRRRGRLMRRRRCKQRSELHCDGTRTVMHAGDVDAMP